MEGPPPEYTNDEWFKKDKLELGLDYPNLPYYIEPASGLKLTQSGAILRYLGAKSGLLGGVPGSVGAAKVDQALYQLQDFRRPISGCVYNNTPSYEKLKGEEMPKYLNLFEAALARQKSAWIAGDQLSIADFVLYEVLHQLHVMLQEKSGEDVFTSYPLLGDLHKRFEELPTIKAYINSAGYCARPFNGAEATVFR